MNNARTVRLLDRQPGKPADDSRTVAGFVIERGVPMPESYGLIPRQRAALLALAVGESIVFINYANDPRRTLRKTHPERAYSHRKLKTGGYRIWRIK